MDTGILSGRLLSAHILLLLLGFQAAVTSQECPEIDFGEVETIASGGADSETVSVGSNEEVLFATEAQLTWDENVPVEDPSPSRLNVVLNRPGDLRPITSIALGLGEATSTAALPSGNQALVTVKDPDRPNVNNGLLKVVGFTGVIESVEVGPGCDSVVVSRDGRFAVVANEAEPPLFPDLSAYRDLDDHAAAYAELSRDAASELPAQLGFATLEALLLALDLEAPEDLLEEAAGGDLPDLLEQLATDLGFETLDLFAVSRGYENGDALLADVSAPFSEEALAVKLLEAGLIAERPDEDVPGSITVLELDGGGPPRVAAVVEGQKLFEALGGESARAARPEDVEPEFAVIAPDSSYALVTLQENSAVAVVDLTVVAESLNDPAAVPAEVGAAALLDVVLLPHNAPNAAGVLQGVEPDGLDISSDGTFAITANESDSGVPHMQGITILDLRGGPDSIAVAATYSIFDLAPDFLEGTKLTEAPVQVDGAGFPDGANLLPRIDPEDTAIFEAGCQSLCGVALERFEKSSRIEGFSTLPVSERRKFGSILVLDVTGALESIDASPPGPDGRGGYKPATLGRFEVGFGKRAPNNPPRPEVIRFLESSSTLVTANENDRGSLSFLPVLLPDPLHTFSLAPTDRPGTFDVLLSTGVEVAGFSFGLERKGVCDSLAVVAITPGEDLDFEPSFFETTSHLEGTVMTVGSVFSLGPSGSVVGPGNDIKIAQVSLCGSVFGDESCELAFTSNLGSPAVLMSIATPQGRSIQPVGISAPVPAGDALCFRRGDANGDQRNDVGDPIFVLSYLFLGGTSLCLDSMDADDDGEIAITDPIVLLDWLFREGTEPPPPGPFQCGPDSTDSSLGCELYESCRAPSD